MCEHNRKIKQFCLFSNCQHPQAAGCPQCFRLYHNHTNYQQILKEEDIATLLKRLNLPQSIKIERKEVCLKLQKLLMGFKNEVNIKLQEIISNMMSKLKYPFLYHCNLLEVYRFLRDKSYHKITPHQLQQFYRVSVNIRQDQFVTSDAQYYQQYLYSIKKDANIYLQKMRDIQQLLNFKLSTGLNQLQKEWIKQMNCLNSKDEQISVCKQLSDSQVIGIEKELADLRSINTLSLTPNKFAHIVDISAQNTPRKSAETLQNECSQTRKTEEQKQFLGSPKLEEAKQQRKCHTERSKSVAIAKECYEQNKIYRIKQKPLFQNTKQDVKTSHLLSSGGNICEIKAVQIIKKCVDKKENAQGYKSVKKQIEKGAQKKEQNNGKEMKQQIIQIIKNRESNIKNRLDEMVKLKEQSQHININKNNQQKQVQDNKKSPKKQLATSMNQNSQVQQRQILKSYLQDTSVFNSNMSEIHNTHCQSPLTRNNIRRQNQSSDSLSKHLFVRERFKDDISPRMINGAITKEIPIANLKVLPNKSFENSEISNESTTQEQQIELAAIFYAGLNEHKSKDKMYFLQKYVAKHINNISAVQCLSYIYLQEGKLKESLNLINGYLDKLSSLCVAEKEKMNLIINKSAALNLLGRYSETITLLLETNFLQNDQAHKNIADAYHNIGMTDKAVYHYEKAIRLNPKFDEAYYNLAVLLYLQQSYFNARMNITKAISINSSSKDYNQLFAHLEQRLQQFSVQK